VFGLAIFTLFPLHGDLVYVRFGDEDMIRDYCIEHNKVILRMANAKRKHPEIRPGEFLDLEIRGIVIKTAREFTQLNPDFVRKKMGVVGVHLQQELRGIPCLELEIEPSAKQNICTSRSFPSDVYNLNVLREAVATHATRCAEKLRQQGSRAAMLQVFITTHPHENGPRHEVCIPLELTTATDSTRELVALSLRFASASYGLE
jgi:nucleotidyltransferase/DNA polymerase involved in DNA repair